MNQIENRRIRFNSLVFTNTSQDIAVNRYWPKVLVTVPLNKINNVTLANEIDKSESISEDLAAKAKPQSSHTISKLLTASMRVLSWARMVI